MSDADVTPVTPSPVTPVTPGDRYACSRRRLQSRRPQTPT
jgi:hypothetical protein